MADLSKEQIKSLALAAGIQIEEPLLTHVNYDLNAVRGPGQGGSACDAHLIGTGGHDSEEARPR